MSDKLSRGAYDVKTIIFVDPIEEVSRLKAELEEKEKLFLDIVKFYETHKWETPNELFKVQGEAFQLIKKIAENTALKQRVKKTEKKG